MDALHCIGLSVSVCSASATDDMARTRTTHVICKSPVGPKYAACLEWNIFPLKPLYLYDCVCHGLLLPCHEYAWNATNPIVRPRDMSSPEARGNVANPFLSRRVQKSTLFQGKSFSFYPHSMQRIAASGLSHLIREHGGQLYDHSAGPRKAGSESESMSSPAAGSDSSPHGSAKLQGVRDSLEKNQLNFLLQPIPISILTSTTSSKLKPMTKQEEEEIDRLLCPCGDVSPLAREYGPLCVYVTCDFLPTCISMRELVDPLCRIDLLVWPSPAHCADVLKDTHWKVDGFEEEMRAFIQNKIQLAGYDTQRQRSHQVGRKEQEDTLK